MSPKMKQRDRNAINAELNADAEDYEAAVQELNSYFVGDDDEDFDDVEDFLEPDPEERNRQLTIESYDIKSGLYFYSVVAYRARVKVYSDKSPLDLEESRMFTNMCLILEDLERQDRADEEMMADAPNNKYLVYHNVVAQQGFNPLDF